MNERLSSSSPEQSLSWELYQQSQGLTEEGSSFNAGFPSAYWGKHYTLICSDGSRVTAVVDNSKEFSFGLQWRTLGLELIASEVVVAWKED